MSIPLHQQFTINPNQTEQKNSRGAAWKGSWEYWVRCIIRLNVFTGKDLRFGFVEHGKIDADTRLTVYLAMEKFLDNYQGVTEEQQRPFNTSQEAEIYRLLSGGFLVKV